MNMQVTIHRSRFAVLLYKSDVLQPYLIRVCGWYSSNARRRLGEMIQVYRHCRDHLSTRYTMAGRRTRIGNPVSRALCLLNGMQRRGPDCGSCLGKCLVRFLSLSLHKDLIHPPWKVDLDPGMFCAGDSNHFLEPCVAEMTWPCGWNSIQL